MAITREETLWIAPYIIASSFITILFIIFDKNCKNKLKKILLYLIPISIYAITILIICTLNKIYYGEFIRIEENSKAFKDFAKAVSSVDVEKPDIRVPLSKEARKKIYEVSPSFKKLENTFDGYTGNMLSSYGVIPGEIEDGWFMWTVFYAMDEHGISSSAKAMNDYLRKITEEVNQAFEDGKLKKEDNPASIFDTENFNRLLQSLKDTYKFQINLDGLDIRLYKDYYNNLNSGELPKDFYKFVEVTGTTSSNALTYNYKTDEIKINILTKISEIYKNLSKPLFYIGLIIYCIMILRFLFIKPRFGNYKELIVLTSFLVLQLLRAFVIAYTNTAKFPAINVLYLSSTYSLQFAFEILALIFGITGAINFAKNYRNK